MKNTLQVGRYNTKPQKQVVKSKTIRLHSEAYKAAATYIKAHGGKMAPLVSWAVMALYSDKFATPKVN